MLPMATASAPPSGDGAPRLKVSLSGLVNGGGGGGRRRAAAAAVEAVVLPRLPALMYTRKRPAPPLRRLALAPLVSP